MGEMTDDQLASDDRVEASYLTADERQGIERDRVVREWALGVAKRHRDRHWCWGVADGTEGQFMFGGRVIGRDCDARNAALSLIGRIEDPEVEIAEGRCDRGHGLCTDSCGNCPTCFMHEKDCTFWATFDFDNGEVK